MVANALLGMYVKCGAIDKAQKVFDELPIRDIISWNSLIGGYAQHGHDEEAFTSFKEMQKRGLSSDEVTYACTLRGCGSMRALYKGQDLHAQILKEHVIEKYILVAYALVDMYAKCGVLEKAQEVFDKLRVRNIVVWTALISGYAEHGCGKEALRCFDICSSRALLWT
ncbi:hypothetical protein L7F22_050932 [Adiantum nelumboides]|nr:hypothetical protein [Adiantum nelumboides]